MEKNGIRNNWDVALSLTVLSKNFSILDFDFLGVQHDRFCRTGDLGIDFDGTLITP